MKSRATMREGTSDWLHFVHGALPLGALLRAAQVCKQWQVAVYTDARCWRGAATLLGFSDYAICELEAIVARNGTRTMVHDHVVRHEPVETELLKASLPRAGRGGTLVHTTLEMYNAWDAPVVIIMRLSNIMDGSNPSQRITLALLVA